MSLLFSTNYQTGGVGLFQWATASSDQLKRIHLTNLATTFEGHDHTLNNGLPVGRLNASQVAGDIFVAGSASTINRLAYTGAGLLGSSSGNALAWVPLATGQIPRGNTGAIPSALATGSKYQQLRMNSTSGDIEWANDAMGRMVTPFTLASSVAETTAATINIPAQTLGTTGALRITVYGTYTGTAGGPSTFTLRLKYGGVIFGIFTASVADTAAARAIGGWSILSAKNSATDQAAFTNIRFGDGAAGSVGTPPTVGGAILTGNVDSVNTAIGVNSVLSQDITVTVQHSVSAGTISVTIYGVTVEFL